jgi:hypothetical protein
MTFLGGNRDERKAASIYMPGRSIHTFPLADEQRNSRLVTTKNAFHERFVYAIRKVGMWSGHNHHIGLGILGSYVVLFLAPMMRGGVRR